MIIKIALNGARSKSENEFIPQSINEIEMEVSRLFFLGYKVYHIHCYDPDGTESLKPDDVNKLVRTVKSISPEILIGISSGEWIEPDLSKRINYIREWEILPDFVSLNFIENDTLLVADALIKKGIPIEAGLNEKKAAEIFAKSNLIPFCCRVLIEPEEEILTEAFNTINEIESVLDTNKIMIKRLMHGFNSVAWDILLEAKNRGYDGRIGMEDTVFLKDGKKVSGNLEIIRAAEIMLKDVNS